ncbi:hypothetical protein NDU88_000214 [Pleurodeles waltl]|uniref:Uncharacterized protein n=1 Tax=Pleurodeles waltl TaxID=8319 RepID=A0AAV7V8C3_PLEWA|nr:hypothetical protein NDU88_000214 [Pleurodeles waltl]
MLWRSLREALTSEVQSHRKEMPWRSLREAPHVQVQSPSLPGAEPSEGDALEESARSPSRSRCRAIGRRCSGGVCEKPLTFEVQSHRKEMLWRSLREAPHVRGAEPSEGDAPEESARSPSCPRCRAIRRRCSGGVCEKPLTSRCRAPHFQVQSHQKEMPWRSLREAPHVRRRCSGGVCEKPLTSEVQSHRKEMLWRSLREALTSKCRATRRRCSGGVCEKPLTSEVQSHQKEMLRRSLREAPHVRGAEPSEGDAPEESARSPSRPRCRAIRRRCSG